jgi:glycosyltransferase involved in cell wall biosynthesis
MPPLVTVIIPVFNRADSLALALRSVAGQTFTDWEAVVVDDGSSDESAEVALRECQPGKVRVIRHEKNLGTSAARNSGILAARGRYIAFLDSDDSWHPEKVRRQVELVEADAEPRTVFCLTQAQVFRAGRRLRVMPKRAPLPGEPWSEYLYVNDGFAQTSTFFLSRELAMKAGFREGLTTHEDHLFFLVAGDCGARCRLIAEPLSNWNDDARADRLSFVAHVEPARRFLEEAGGLLTEKARLGFEVRHLGPLLFRENPVEAAKLFRLALTKRAVRRHQLLSVWARSVFPAPAIAVLRRRLYALTN